MRYQRQHRPIRQSAQETVLKAKESALRLLRYRARSERELFLRLRAKGFSEAVVRNVLHRLKSVGLVDDAALAETIVQSALNDNKPHSRWEVRCKLHGLGIPDELIEHALTVWTDEVERQMAERYLRRRLPPSAMISPKEVGRAFRAALQRGFDITALRDALRTLKVVPDDLA